MAKPQLARIEESARECYHFLSENEEISDLGEELADVLFVLICIANQTGVDLESSFKEKLEKKTTRDKSRHKDNPKLK